MPKVEAPGYPGHPPPLSNAVVKLWHYSQVKKWGKPTSQRPFIAKGNAQQFSHDMCREVGSWFGLCVPLALGLSFENSELNCSTA